MNTSLSRLLNKLAFVSPGIHTLRPWLQRMRGVHVGRNVGIGQYVYFDELHPGAISIGDNCSIGIRTSIIAHLYWGPKRGEDAARKVTIEKNAFIGPHCVILPGTTIGEGSVIQANTTVTGNVPPHTLWGHQVAGPLAQVTVPLTLETSYEKFLYGLRRLPPKAK